MARTVFVYGTLKRGFYNNRLLVNNRAAFVCEAITVNKWPLVVGRWAVPYIFQPDNEAHGHNIAGELWSVSKRCLRELDELEGVSKGRQTT